MPESPPAVCSARALELLWPEHAHLGTLGTAWIYQYGPGAVHLPVRDRGWWRCKSSRVPGPSGSASTTSSRRAGRRSGAHSSLTACPLARPCAHTDCRLRLSRSCRPSPGRCLDRCLGRCWALPPPLLPSSSPRRRHSRCTCPRRAALAAAALAAAALAAASLAAAALAASLPPPSLPPPSPPPPSPSSPSPPPPSPPSPPLLSPSPPSTHHRRRRCRHSRRHRRRPRSRPRHHHRRHRRRRRRRRRRRLRRLHRRPHSHRPAGPPHDNHDGIDVFDYLFQERTRYAPAPAACAYLRPSAVRTRP
jgi:hypothetical protein